MSGLAIVDGVASSLDEARLPVTDPAITVGWSVFETMRALDGQIRHVDRHLARLLRSVEASGIPAPDVDLLRHELQWIADRIPSARLRVTLTGAGRRIVSGELLDLSRVNAGVRVVRLRADANAFMGGEIKHGSRGPWVSAVARLGVDDIVMVDNTGHISEATSAAVIAVIDGVVQTRPVDGAILDSTTCAAVLACAERLSIPVRREPIPSNGPWDALYLASTTRLLAPVVELDGERLPGWCEIGRRLRDAMTL